MPSLTVDISNINPDLSMFPNGVYEAQVLTADLEISKNSGNPMITLQLEFHHPKLGSGVVKDWLSPGFKSKIKSFWMAANGFDHEQAVEALRSGGEIDLDPDELVGVQLLINLGEQEGRNDPSRMFKTVVAPFFFPVNRKDLLTWQEGEPL